MAIKEFLFLSALGIVGWRIVEVRNNPAVLQAQDDLRAELSVSGHIVSGGFSQLTSVSAEQAYQMIQAGQIFDLKNSNISRYFDWGEVFANRTSNEIRTITLQQLKNAVRHAQVLDKVRDAYGKPIHIASWWRDKESNRRAGGAYNSDHVKGLAIDIDHFSKSEKKKILDSASTISEVTGLGYPASSNKGHIESFTNNGRRKNSWFY